MNIYHTDKQEDKMPDQKHMVSSGDKDMTDGAQGHDNRYEAPETKVIQNMCKSRSGEIQMRSGHKSQKPERLCIKP